MKRATLATRRSLVAPLVLALLTARVAPASAQTPPPPPTPAPTKSECVAAHTEAQHLRLVGQLREARAQLLVCSSPTCPEPVTVECVPWLAEVERALPTVVFEARLADGSDAVDVTVRVDGARVTDKLDGRAIPVDPGAHLIRFESATSTHAIERRVVVAEGEKTRVVRADFPPPDVLAPVPPPPSPSNAPHWSTYVIGGASVLSFGGFAYFGLTGESKVSALDSCKPYCPMSNPVTRDYLAANVFLGVGIATAAAAIIVGITTALHHPSSSAPPPASAQVFSFDRSMLK